ncbi:peptidoglycan-binding protein [Cardiobacteriaceae bacterium TAE3-ERU3]|nr:peptidoglycan-binding protein [Cardiobacteriaceae bacterium TAE3-ERU3]
MMKRKMSALLVAGAITTLVHAQTQNENQANEETDAAVSAQNSERHDTLNTLSVPQASAGECQALVIVPAQFEAKTEQVTVKEASETIEVIPAEYEWVEEQVMIKPAGERLEVVPATYKTIEEEIEIEPAVVEKEVIEPQFAEVTEEVLSKPAYMAPQNATGGVAGNGGEVLRLVEVPAENSTITKHVVQEDVQVKETPVEAKYVTVQKQVIDQPAEVKKVPYEAEYETVRVKKLVKEAEEVRKEIPAEYAEVTVYDKISDAQMRWEKVLCENTVNKGTIEEVQRALNAQGYKAGVVDGALGPSTTRALEKYQRDNNLGVGGVTMETLDSLGINR